MSEAVQYCEKWTECFDDVPDMRPTCCQVRRVFNIHLRAELPTMRTSRASFWIDQVNRDRTYHLGAATTRVPRILTLSTPNSRAISGGTSSFSRAVVTAVPTGSRDARSCCYRSNTSANRFETPDDALSAVTSAGLSARGSVQSRNVRSCCLCSTASSGSTAGPRYFFSASAPTLRAELSS